MVFWAPAVVAVLLASLWLLQRRLIYLPGQATPSVASVLPGWDEVDLATSDGLNLKAWYKPPGPSAAVVIVFNGNAGNRSDRASLGAALERSGFGVLLVDYRGYGGNPGRPTEEGLARDARAAAAFVAEAAPAHPVAYYGESLGSAVAIELALTRPPAALVLRSPFTSLADVAALHYRLLPVRLLLWDRYPSAERIGGVAAPVLVVVGSKDSIIPAAQSRELFALAGPPKELVVVQGADHNDPALLAGDTLIEAVVRFVRASVTGG